LTSFEGAVDDGFGEVEINVPDTALCFCLEQRPESSLSRTRSHGESVAEWTMSVSELAFTNGAGHAIPS
jgi:hypothetical protein